MNTANISSLRRAHGLTQAEMASIIGVNQRQYSNIELGKSDITIDKIEALMQRFQVSADYILGLTKSPTLTGPEAEDAARIAELYIQLDDKGKARVKTAAYNELDRMMSTT